MHSLSLEQRCELFGRDSHRTLLILFRAHQTLITPAHPVLQSEKREELVMEPRSAPLQMRRYSVSALCLSVQSWCKEWSLS